MYDSFLIYIFFRKLIILDQKGNFKATGPYNKHRIQDIKTLIVLVFLIIFSQKKI